MGRKKVASDLKARRQIVRRKASSEKRICLVELLERRDHPGAMLPISLANILSAFLDYQISNEVSSQFGNSTALSQNSVSGLPTRFREQLDRRRLLARPANIVEGSLSAEQKDTLKGNAGLGNEHSFHLSDKTQSKTNQISSPRDRLSSPHFSSNFESQIDSSIAKGNVGSAQDEQNVLGGGSGNGNGPSGNGANSGGSSGEATTQFSALKPADNSALPMGSFTTDMNVGGGGGNSNSDDSGVTMPQEGSTLQTRAAQTNISQTIAENPVSPSLGKSQSPLLNDPSTPPFVKRSAASNPSGTLSVNSLPKSEWQSFENGGSDGLRGRVEEAGNALSLFEGDSLQVVAYREIVLPVDMRYLTLDYAAAFDLTDRNHINDAFEVALIDVNGKSIVPSISVDRDSLFNFTEEEQVAIGVTTSHSIRTSVNGSSFAGTITIDALVLHQLASPARIVVRLVNNDSDYTSNLRLVVNTPPDTAPDEYSSNVGRPIDISASEGLLRNDSDSDGDAIVAVQSVLVTNGPSFGSLTLNPNGSFIYTPNSGFTGDDRFSYRAFDGTSYSMPTEVKLRYVPTVVGLFVDSTLWNNRFAFATNGYEIVDSSPNLPWFNLNQVRVKFSEPISTVTVDDVSLAGGTIGGQSSRPDYNLGLTIAQPDPTTLELTLRNGLVFQTDKIVVRLLETITDSSGNGLDGNNDGRSGDPSNKRFNVVRGDVDNNSFTLANDVTTVTEHQFGRGTYDPFYDLNGNTSILANDVTLVTQNQFSYPSADTAWTFLAPPVLANAISSRTKFYVVDKIGNSSFRYNTAGQALNPIRIDSVSNPRGIAVTGAGDKAWVVSTEGVVSVYDLITGYFIGAWQSIPTLANSTSEVPTIGKPEDITTDGSHIWIVDANLRQVLFYENGANRLQGNQQPQSLFSLNAENTSPSGIVTDGDRLWVTDDRLSQVFVYELSGNYLGTWALDPRNASPSGITLNPAGTSASDGNDLWVVDRADSVVYRYANSKSLLNGEANALSVFALSPSNSMAEGIADPPPAAPSILPTVSYIGPNGGSWHSPLNWSTSTVPTSDDIAEIPTGRKVIYSNGITSIKGILGEGTLELASPIANASNTAVLTVTQEAAISNVIQKGGVFVLDGSTVVGSYQLQNGILRGSGTVSSSNFEWTGGGMQGDGVTKILSTAPQDINLTISGSELWIGNGRSIQNEGNIAWNGNVFIGTKRDIYSTNLESFDGRLTKSNSAVSVKNLKNGVVDIGAFDNKFSPKGLIGSPALFYGTEQLATFENLGLIRGVKDFYADALWTNNGTIEFLSGTLGMGEGISNSAAGMVRAQNIHVGSLRIPSFDGYATPIGLMQNDGILQSRNGAGVLGEIIVYVSDQTRDAVETDATRLGQIINSVSGSIEANAFHIGFEDPIFGVGTSLVNSGRIHVSYSTINGSLINNQNGTVTTSGMRIGIALLSDPSSPLFRGSLENYGTIDFELRSSPPIGWSSAQIHTIEVAGNFINRGMLKLPISGSVATNQFGRIKVLVGFADLDGGLILNPTGGAVSVPGEFYTLVEVVRNQSDILGAFDSWPEGQPVTLFSSVFHATYRGGNGENDFQLVNNGWYVRIDDPFVVEGNAPNNAIAHSEVLFRIELDAPAITPVTIPYQTQDIEAVAGTDYEFTSGVVTIHPGETSAIVKVRVLKDVSLEESSTRDRNERFSLRLGTPTTNNAVLQKAGGIATILGDDGPVDAVDTRGREFWLAYTNTQDPNMAIDGQLPNDYMVYVAGAPGTRVTITTFPQDGTSSPQVFTDLVIPPSGLLERDLAGAMLLPDVTGVIGSANTFGLLSSTVNVQASSDVSVYSLMFFTCGTSSSALSFPNDVLGGEYRILTPKNVNASNAMWEMYPGDSDIPGGLFAAIATEDDTRIVVTPTVRSEGHRVGVPFEVTLQRGQVYQYIASNRQNADLSGTLVTSDKPIAVISGHQFAQVPKDLGYRDSTMESVPPVNTWGREFIIADTKRDPLPGKPSIEDNYRVLATENETVVRVNNTIVATLDSGQVYEFQMDGQGTIKANKPVMVMQMTDGSPNATATANDPDAPVVAWGMPSAILIPPYEQFLAEYTLAIPSFFPDGYINIVTPTSGIAGLRLNGNPLTQSQLDLFSQVNRSEYSVARLKVSPGQSVHVKGVQPFGVTVYGFEFHNSHGYLGGLSLSPVATASGIALSPVEASRQVTLAHSVTARISNEAGIGVPGVRVDFLVTGANQTLGFAVTDIRGEATFEYVGVNLGVDKVSASVGQLEAVSSVDWNVAAPTIDVQSPLNGTSFQAGTTLLITGRARAGQNGVSITRVLIDDVPVEALDTQGNFFAHVTLSNGIREMKITAYDSFGQSVSTTYSLQGTVGPSRGLDTRSLVDVANLMPEYLRTSFYDDRRSLFTDVRFVNNGSFDLEKPLYIGIRNLSDASVLVEDFDGFTEDGTYYWNFSSNVVGEVFGKGDRTTSRSLSFRNPNRVRFTYDWVVLSNVNDPPEFTSTPRLAVHVGQQYVYSPKAMDKEGHQVSFELVAGPNGLTIDDNTGMIRWVPSSLQSGNHSVSIQAVDSRGSQSIQTFVVEVLDPTINRTPIISSTPIVMGNVGLLYEYSIDSFDPDGDAVTFSVTSSNGNTDGMGFVENKLRWIPTADQVGLQAITVVASDGKLSSKQSFVLNVSMQVGNSAPTISSTPRTKIAQGVAYQYQVIASDVDSDKLHFSLSDAPTGIIIDPNTGLITWENPQAPLNSNVVTIHAKDNRGGVATQSFNLNFSLANMSFSGAVKNKTDNQDNGLANWVVFIDSNRSGVRDASEAFATTNGSGQYSISNLLEDQYSVRVERPTQQWIIDSPSSGHFIRNLAIGNSEVIANNIVLPDFELIAHPTALNRSPTFTPVSDKEIAPEKTLSFLIAATDLDGDAIRYDLRYAQSGMKLDPITGLFTWTPSRDWAGESTTVIVSATDPFQGVRTLSFSIAVTRFNSPPVFLSLPSAPAFVSKAYSYRAVASDPEGRDVFYSLTNALPGMTVNATNGAFHWTPTSLQQGNHTFTIRATDTEQNFSEQTFVLTVIAPNQLPIIASSPTMTANVNRVFLYDIIASDPDPGDSVSITVLSKPDWLSIVGNTLTGMPSIIDVTPANSSGSSIVLRVADSRGGIRTQSFLVRVVDSLSVQPTNTAPVFISGPSMIATLDSRYSANIVVADPDLNDMVSLLPGPSFPEWLTLTPNPGIANSYRLSGTPSSSDLGSQSLQKVTIHLKAMDSRGASSSDSFDIFVIRENSSPSVSLSMSSIISPYIQSIGRIQAEDPDSDLISFTKISGPSGVTIDSYGVIRWQPNESDISTTPYVMEFLVSDGQGHSVAVQHVIHVSADSIVNHKPIIISNTPLTTPLGTVLQYQAVAKDQDNDALWWRMVSSPEGAVIDPSSGLISWMPDQYQAGLTHRFEIEVSDLRSSATQVFAVHVNKFNRPPEIESTSISNATVGNIYAYAVRAIDPDDSSLTYALLIPNLAPAELDPRVQGAAINSKGVLHWKPQVAGRYRFQISVADDQGGVTIQEFTVVASNSVASLNRPPVWIQNPSLSGNAGQPYASILRAVDPDQDSVTYRLLPITEGDLLLGELDLLDPVNTVVAPSDLALSNGVLQFTPAFAKPYRLRLEARDSFGGVSENDYVINVSNIGAARPNRAPILSNTPFNTAFVGVDFVYLAKANDLDGDSLSYLLKAPTALLIGEIDGRATSVGLDPNTGELRWTPHAPGVYRFRLSIDDSFGGVIEQEFVVDVELPADPFNAPPLITSLPVSRTIGGATYRYPIKAIDPDGDVLSYTLHRLSEVDSNTTINGASINGNGLLTWSVPPGSEGKTYRFDLSVSDQVAGNPSAIHEFNVHVVSTPIPTTSKNEAPRFDFTPKVIATAAQAFSDMAFAVDPDGDAVRYFLLEGASEGISIDSDTGKLSWLPSPLNAGQPFRDAHVAVQAIDTFGKSTFERYTIRVMPLNSPPTIQSISHQNIIAGLPLAIDVMASDPDGDKLSYAVDGLPDATIDDRGRLRFVSTRHDVGSVYNVSVTSMDAGGASDIVAFTVTIKPDISIPIVSLNVNPSSRLKTNDPAQIRITSKDNVRIVRQEVSFQIVPVGGTVLESNWVDLFVDPNGNAVYIPATPGVLHLRGRAFDESGNIGVKLAILDVYDPSLGQSIPILNPIHAGPVTTLTDIMGAVTGNVAKWYLQIGSLTASYSNPFRWSTIASGNDSLPANSLMGVLDPTSIENGAYQLRLLAYNGNGESVETTRTVTIEGLQKVGNFTVAFTDLSLSVAGLPITVARSYDTLRANQSGDFGNGWQLVQQSFSSQLQLDTPTILGARGYPGFTNGTRVLITLPDGTVEGFTFDPKPSRVMFGSVISYRPNFKPDVGNKSVLEVNEVELTKTNDEYTNETLDTYSPLDPLFGNEYIVTTFPDRQIHVFNATTGEIKATQDHNGNFVAITDDGVEGSRNRALMFDRDWAGRITRITDPQGNVIIYEYDNLGNLTKFYDRVQAARLIQHQTLGQAYAGPLATPVEYVYSSPSTAGIDRSDGYLISIVDPSGMQSLSNEYSSLTGRLSSVTDANGKTVQLNYDLSQAALSSGSTAGQVTITATNQLGKTTSVIVDSRGNPIRQTNEVGDVTLTEFAPRTAYPTKQVTVIGQLDSALNGQSDDIVSSATYNRYGQATSQTDAYGAVTTMQYSPQGQLQSTADADGNKTMYGYDRRGNLSGTFDSFGVGTRYVYHGNGDLKSIASNIIQSFDPDTDDFYKRVLEKNIADVNANFSPKALPRETIEEKENFKLASVYYQYLLEQAKYSAYQAAYSAWTESVLSNNVTSLSYNETGDLIKVVDPDKNTRTLISDGNGYQTSNSFIWNDPNDANVTSIVVSNVALDFNGRPTQNTTTVDGVLQTSVQTFYDDLGRAWKTIDANGLESRTVFDVRGLVIEKRSQSQDSSGTKFWNVSRTVYDDAGRAIYSSNSALEGTAVSEIYGSQSIYDDAGRITISKQLKGVDIKISTTPSPAGQQVSAASLVGVPDVISETKTEYVPASNGRVANTTDQYGRVTELLYDAHGNTIQSRTQTYDEFATPMWLVTRTVFDSRGRATFSSDPFLMPSSSSPYDLSPFVMGNKTLFDDLGRNYGSERVADARVRISSIGAGATIQFVTLLDDPGAVISKTRTEYDGQGRAFRQIAADGQTTTTLYDARGRSVATLGTAVESSLVGLGNQYPGKLVRLLSETEYNQYGQAFRSITNIVEVLDPASFKLLSIDRSNQRVTDQHFDALGRVVETVYPDGTSIKKEYDQRGRVVKEIDQMGQVKDLSYDAIGRLVKVELPAVANPLNSNLQMRPIYQYEYNSFGQMSKLVDANGHETLFDFDSLGRQTARALPLSNTLPIAPGPNDPIPSDNDLNSTPSFIEWTQHDLRGRSYLTKSFEGVITRTIYDDTIVGGGRVSEKQLFKNGASYNNGIGTPLHRITMRYDAFGRNIQTQHHYQETGITDTWSTDYDSQGRVIKETSPTGFIQYEYDSLGRKTRTQSGSAVSALNPQNNSPVSAILIDTHYTYDRLGKLATVATTTRDGQPVDIDPTTTGSQPETTSYFFDLLGRSDYTVMPNEVVEDFTFDSMDRLDVMRHLRSDTNNADLTDNAIRDVFDYTYRADGKRTSLTESFTVSGSERNSSYTWSYDPAGRLTSEVLDHWDDVFDQSESYIFDLVGNRLQKSIDKAGVDNDKSVRYQYDANDRIVGESSFANLFATGMSTESTGYTWNATQQSSKTVTQSGVNVSVQSMAYGLTGQLEQVTTETRNAQNELQSRVRVEYRYDTSGIRFIAIDSTDSDLSTPAFDSLSSGRTEYLIDHMTMTGYGQAIIETKYNASNQAIQRTSYTFGPDEIAQTVTDIDPTSGLQSHVSSLTFAHDGHGSTRALFAAAATLTQLFTYTAYGELLSIHNGTTAAIISGTTSTLASPASSRTSILYNGESLDRTTNLYNFRARWYSASNVRFERLDPYIGNPNDPFSFNKYGFVHGDPVQGVDPSGEVLGAIDGTGTEDWLHNPRNPRRTQTGRWMSHVRNFKEDYNGAAFYENGPSKQKTGSDLSEKIQIIFDQLEKHYQINPGDPIDLVGWSRGAYAVLLLAHKINNEGFRDAQGTRHTNIPIRFLGLYDPVDMTFDDGNYYSVFDIPSNVRRAVSFHGEESEGLDRMDYDSWHIGYDWPRMILNASGTTIFTNRAIAATHGAIGGTPGYTPAKILPTDYSYAANRAISIEVDDYMRATAGDMGVPISRIDPSAYGFPLKEHELPKISPRTLHEFIHGPTYLRGGGY